MRLDVDEAALGIRHHLVWLVRQLRRDADFTREKLNLRLLTRLQVAEQDQQGFGVLLGQKLEGSIIWFGVHLLYLMISDSI